MRAAGWWGRAVTAATVCGVLAVASSSATASGTLRDRVGNGVEIQVQSTRKIPAEFAAIARGALPGTLGALVFHSPDRLAAGMNMTIYRGSLEIVAGPEGTVTGEVVSGTVFAHGHATAGACPAVSPYRVVIALADVRVPGQSGPTTGTFRGTLTHYSTNRSGTCQPYAASLKGELSILA